MAQLNALRLIMALATNKDGPTVLQDRFGSTAAAQLACWHLMHCQLDNENTVDVYQTAVLACQMRPRVFTSPTHLKFLYEAALLEAKVRCSSPGREVGKRQNNPVQTGSNQIHRSANIDEVVTEKSGLLTDDMSSTRQESAAQSLETESSVTDDVIPTSDEVIAVPDEVFETNPM
uniref:Tyrosine-protein phosphatase domain-containing protein n=1 Tax=Ciona savignyi TaxID=51511 RepID=H2ZLA1_CIOSA